MKRIYLAPILSLALVAPATAADMSPPRMYTKAAPVAAPSPAFDWSGFYAGAHFGYTGGRAHVVDNGVLTEDAARMNGLVGGALAGYNWQNGVFVFGLEGDFGVSGLLGHGIVAPVAPPNQYNVDLSGNLRGRVGVAVLPTTLLYAAGGLAMANFDFRDEGAPILKTKTMVGWTVGGGIDQAFTRNLIGRVEYLYSDYGHKDFTLSPGDVYNIGFKSQTVRGALIWKFDPAYASAFAADLGTRPYTKAPAMAPVRDWSGVYTGVNAGYGWGNGNTSFTALPSATAVGLANSTFNSKPKGAIGGVQAGYNWQTGAFVAGLEADIQGTSLHDSSTGTFRSADQKLSWFGTARGRLGMAVVPDLLLYGTGGLAYGRIQTSAGSSTSSQGVGYQFIGDFNGMKAGWTAGGGAEWMFARNWSAKAEYLYLDLGKVSALGLPTSASIIGQSVDTSTQVRDHTVRIGVNYHLN